MVSPSFIFDIDEFTARINTIRAALSNNIHLCYSIKANPFLLPYIPDCISKVEVCSPGELQICKALKIDPKLIIYSGVMKEITDITDAVTYGASILTAESIRHMELESRVCTELGQTANVIMRLSSGNQFGMSEDDIRYILSHRDSYPGINIMGIHYYSGTQKKQKTIAKELVYIDDFIQSLEKDFGFKPDLVEYGPGLPVNYFKPPYDEADIEALNAAAECINTLAAKYHVGIEMGRFMAATCGSYITRVKDLKTTEATCYCILDGGINHLKYHGQTMAMQVPPITVKGKNDEASASYCLCGSLCTVADVLVRQVELPELCIDDTLVFERCGAYSVTEGTVLFLSRNMPEVYISSKADGLIKVREMMPSHILNTVKQY